MGKMKLLRDVVDNLHELADSISCMADAIEEKPAEASSAPSFPNEQSQTDASSEVTLQALREVLGSLSINGKTPQVKALLLKYHASNVSGVEPQYREALMAEARQIK